jgi:murein L,D-transpeptidase YafK
MNNILKINLLYLTLMMISYTAPAQTFVKEQKQYSRVKTAYQEKEQVVKQKLEKVGVTGTYEIFIRAFKSEKILEVWVKAKGQTLFVHLCDYAICSSSGDLGPKRKQGDCQTPEGFYHIDRFNPASNFYLSLGVSYPNSSDKILGNKGNLGGDIFIHGNCVTIGCIPLTDDIIKELYILAVEAKSNGQAKIPVHIFPFRMSEENMTDYGLRYSENKDFWENLQEGYNFFEKNKSLPSVTVDTKGKYLFKL